jgi:hypothetical protein
MNKISHYQNFIWAKGRPLSEINPGSSEFGLKISDALRAIELLQGTDVIIVGGDVLSDESGKLIYTYENWDVEKINKENLTDYANRSYDIAKKYINKISENTTTNKLLYIVFVTKSEEGAK